MSSRSMYYSLAFWVILSVAVSFVILPEADVFSASISPSPQATVNTFAHDVENTTPPPVIIWHGLGDSSDADGLADIAKLVQEVHPGTYVHIISVGDPASDRRNSWFGQLDEQVDQVCQQLASDRILASAPHVDAIGFSQGGQFLRAYQQRCGHWAPSIRSLLTFGSQHNGIAEFQKCKSATDFICQGANALLKGSTVWSDFVQTRLVPAQYYRDTRDYDNYLEHSHFLADVNNERKVKNQTYVDNLIAMDRFVMIIFEGDETVIPKESGWFAEVDSESGNVTTLQDRPIYKEDWLGLKKLDEKNGLVFDSVPGGHMRLNDRDLKRLFKQHFGSKPDPVSSSSSSLSVPVRYEPDL